MDMNDNFQTHRSIIESKMVTRSRVIEQLPRIIAEAKTFIGFGLTKEWDGEINFLGITAEGQRVYFQHPSLNNIYSMDIIERVAYALLNKGLPYFENNISLPEYY